MILPDQNHLLAALRYDGETGKLFWRERADMRPQWNARYAGKEAGFCGDPRRIVLTLDGRLGLRAHRVIWKMVFGEDAPLLDHIDGNPHNNRISNLRIATKEQNAQNTKSNNKTGFKGVTFHRLSGMWHARIYHAGTHYCLGYHKAPELAHQAYVEAAKRMFGEFARAA